MERFFHPEGIPGLRQGFPGLRQGCTYTGKSVDVTLTPTTPGDPYMFQARAQGRRDDANYGNPSAAITLTLIP